MIAVGVAGHIGWFGWASAVSTALFVAFAFWVFALCLLDDVRSRLAQLLEWSVILPTTAVAVIGLWALVQGWAVVVVLGFAACHPWVVAWARRDDVAGSESTRPDAPESTDRPALPGTHPAAKSAGLTRPSRLGDDALRQCWEASWALLQRAKTLDEAIRIVDYRRTCLDEIARRNSATFERWLEAGAPNAHEPARHLPSTFTVESSS